MTSIDVAKAPLREARLLPVDLDIERRPDGTILLRSRIALEPYDANLPAVFARTAARAPDKPALARRAPGGGDWRFLTYGELKRDIDATTQWLLDHAPKGRPILVMAGSAPAFATMTLAGWAAGLPVCPVSTAYGALGGDHGRLKHVIAKIKPGVFFVDDPAPIAEAMDSLGLGDAILVAGNLTGLSRRAIPFAELIATTATSAVDVSIASRLPGDTAAYMLTSGSTGLPKLVGITFDNLAANTAQCHQTFGKAAAWHDVILDWLPWHHAAGAFVMRTTLLAGGTLYIDEGKPVPGLFDQSVRNLREIGVSYYNNVPLGFTMLVDALEADPLLRKTFFSRLALVLYGGAGLSQPVYDRLQRLAVAETGCRISLTSGYGSTETVSGCLAIHWETDKVGIGLPSPGVTVKLSPAGERYELRLKGPNVTGGYLDEPQKTAEVFDDEGFYRTGDMAVFHDPSDPAQGLAFAGRAAEEFKLSSGNWVYGGRLREDLIKALSPMISDLVLCDDNRPYLTAMIWPGAGATREAIAEGLLAFNEAQHGSASTIRRAILLMSPPNANAHEISDKGSINRRAVLDRRKVELERLYADPPDPEIIDL